MSDQSCEVRKTQHEISSYRSKSVPTMTVLLVDNCQAMVQKQPGSPRSGLCGTGLHHVKCTSEASTSLRPIKASRGLEDPARASSTRRPKTGLSRAGVHQVKCLCKAFTSQRPTNRSLHNRVGEQSGCHLYNSRNSTQGKCPGRHSGKGSVMGTG